MLSGISIGMASDKDMQRASIQELFAIEASFMAMNNGVEINFCEEEKSAKTAHGTVKMSRESGGLERDDG